MIRQSFTNLKLRQKILVMILIVALFFCASSLCSYMILQKSNNHLIYKSLISSVNSSADQISTELTDIESLSNTIVSNHYIRNGLSSLMDQASTSVHINNVKNTISSFISEYHYRVSGISYIMIKCDQMVATSYEPLSSKIPPEINDSILNGLKASSGYPIWITDYCNKEGLFLGRNILRVKQLKQETLGTAIINVDINKLVKASSRSILPGFDVHFILFSDGKEIYHSSALSENDVETICSQKIDSYKIIHLSDQPYFCVSSTIASTGWNYICLVPYASINQTIHLSFLLSIGIVSLGIGLALIITLRMTRRITHDFSELIDKMHQFSQNETVIPSSAVDYSGRHDEAGVLHNQFDEMTEEIQHLIKENYVKDILTKDAQIKSLQSQINPHFLYNALDSVNWRAKSIGAEDISVMVESLGRLLRASLSHTQNVITLKDELNIVHSYIAIQKMRFDEERLKYLEDIPEELLSISIPKMTIQPLVDNAINYAMELITEQCVIEVMGRRSDSVHIYVRNNGSQFDHDLLSRLRSGQISTHGVGIGILNIHDRIQLLFGKEYGIRLFNQDDDHAVVDICLPGGNNA